MPATARSGASKAVADEDDCPDPSAGLTTSLVSAPVVTSVSASTPSKEPFASKSERAVRSPPAELAHTAQAIGHQDSQDASSNQQGSSPMPDASEPSLQEASDRRADSRSARRSGPPPSMLAGLDLGGDAPAKQTIRNPKLVARKHDFLDLARSPARSLGAFIPETSETANHVEAQLFGQQSRTQTQDIMPRSKQIDATQDDSRLPWHQDHSHLKGSPDSPRHVSLGSGTGKGMINVDASVHPNSRNSSTIRSNSPNLDRKNEIHPGKSIANLSNRNEDTTLAPVSTASQNFEASEMQNYADKSRPGPANARHVSHNDISLQESPKLNRWQRRRAQGMSSSSSRHQPNAAEAASDAKSVKAQLSQHRSSLRKLFPSGQANQKKRREERNASQSSDSAEEADGPEPLDSGRSQVEANHTLSMQASPSQMEPEQQLADAGSIDHHAVVSSAEGLLAEDDFGDRDPWMEAAKRASAFEDPDEQIQNSSTSSDEGERDDPENSRAVFKNGVSSSPSRSIAIQASPEIEVEHQLPTKHVDEFQADADRLVSSVRDSLAFLGNPEFSFDPAAHSDTPTIENNVDSNAQQLKLQSLRAAFEDVDSASEGGSDGDNDFLKRIPISQPLVKRSPGKSSTSWDEDDDEREIRSEGNSQGQKDMAVRQSSRTSISYAENDTQSTDSESDLDREDNGAINAIRMQPKVAPDGRIQSDSPNTTNSMHSLDNLEHFSEKNLNVAQTAPPSDSGTERSALSYEQSALGSHSLSTSQPAISLSPSRVASSGGFAMRTRSQHSPLSPSQRSSNSLSLTPKKEETYSDSNSQTEHCERDQTDAVIMNASLMEEAIGRKSRDIQLLNMDAAHTEQTRSRNQGFLESLPIPNQENEQSIALDNHSLVNNAGAKQFSSGSTEESSSPLPFDVDPETIARLEAEEDAADSSDDELCRIPPISNQDEPCKPLSSQDGSTTPRMTDADTLRIVHGSLATGKQYGKTSSRHQRQTTDTGDIPSPNSHKSESTSEGHSKGRVSSNAGSVPTTIPQSRLLKCDPAVEQLKQQQKVVIHGAHSQHKPFPTDSSQSHETNRQQSLQQSSIQAAEPEHRVLEAVSHSASTQDSNARLAYLEMQVAQMEARERARKRREERAGGLIQSLIVDIVNEAVEAAEQLRSKEQERIRTQALNERLGLIDMALSNSLPPVVLNDVEKHDTSVDEGSSPNAILADTKALSPMPVDKKSVTPDLPALSENVRASKRQYVQPVPVEQRAAEIVSKEHLKPSAHKLKLSSQKGSALDDDQSIGLKDDDEKTDVLQADRKKQEGIDAILGTLPPAIGLALRTRGVSAARSLLMAGGRGNGATAGSLSEQLRVILQAVENFEGCDRSARVLQRWARGSLKQSSARVFAARKLQGHLRQLRLRCVCSAAILQSLVRRTLAPGIVGDLLSRHSAASTIQRKFRNHRALCSKANDANVSASIPMLRNIEDIAATNSLPVTTVQAVAVFIQSVYRGHMARSYVWSKRRNYRCSGARLHDNAPVLRDIQSTRRKIMRVNGVIPHASAALEIQRMWRGTMARMQLEIELQLRKLEAQSKASRTLQNCARIWLAKKVWRTLSAAQHFKRGCAASVIQRHYRAALPKLRKRRQIVSVRQANVQSTSRSSGQRTSRSSTSITSARSSSNSGKLRGKVVIGKLPLTERGLKAADPPNRMNASGSNSVNSSCKHAGTNKTQRKSMKQVGIVSSSQTPHTHAQHSSVSGSDFGPTFSTSHSVASSHNPSHKNRAKMPKESQHNEAQARSLPSTNSRKPTEMPSTGKSRAISGSGARAVKGLSKSARPVASLPMDGHPNSPAKTLDTSSTSASKPKSTSFSARPLAAASPSKDQRHHSQSSTLPLKTATSHQPLHQHSKAKSKRPKPVQDVKMFVPDGMPRLQTLDFLEELDPKQSGNLSSAPEEDSFTSTHPQHAWLEGTGSSMTMAESLYGLSEPSSELNSFADDDRFVDLRTEPVSITGDDSVIFNSSHQPAGSMTKPHGATNESNSEFEKIYSLRSDDAPSKQQILPLYLRRAMEDQAKHTPKRVLGQGSQQHAESAIDSTNQEKSSLSPARRKPPNGRKNSSKTKQKSDQVSRKPRSGRISAGTDRSKSSLARLDENTSENSIVDCGYMSDTAASTSFKEISDPDSRVTAGEPRHARTTRKVSRKAERSPEEEDFISYLKSLNSSPSIGDKQEVEKQSKVDSASQERSLPPILAGGAAAAATTQSGTAALHAAKQARKGGGLSMGTAANIQSSRNKRPKSSQQSFGSIIKGRSNTT